MLFGSYVVGMSRLCRSASQSELGGELAASREPGDAELPYGSLGWLCRVLQFLRCCLVIWVQCSTDTDWGLNPGPWCASVLLWVRVSCVVALGFGRPGCACLLNDECFDV